MNAEDVKTEWYLPCPEKFDRGMIFYTECGNRIYSIRKDEMLYEGKICPKCSAVLHLKSYTKMEEKGYGI